MNVSRRITTAALAVLLSGAAALLAAPQGRYAPPPPVKPDDETMQKIRELRERLDERIRRLRQAGIHDPMLADVEVYQKAAAWVVRHNEFYHKDAARWTIEALERGLLRAAQQGQGEAPWYNQAGFAVVHGYRSQVDGSVQPYAVTYPADYGKDTHKKWRLEVVLHGRDSSLTEVSFLHRHNGERPAPKDLDHVMLEVYGRGNLGYRWAGETDVSEAINHFLTVEQLLKRGDLLDAGRGVLRGFSMGGAGAWHIGLHYPDHWCAISPGAGFTTTRGYIKDLPKLTPEQEACLHIYDAADYAENAFDVPVIAYGGETDPQLQAARNVEERLKKLDIPMKLLVAPKLGHQFPPEWQKKMAEARAEYVAKGRTDYPERVRFVTYTMKYAGCYWVQLEGMHRHYERAWVDARHTDDGFEVKTANVRTLRLMLPPGAGRRPVTVQIDGQKVEAAPYLPVPNSRTLFVYLDHRDDRWRPVLYERLVVRRLRRPRKITGLQGPIDDAFMEPFLCVRGTGTPWHEATDAHARASLKRFRDEWSKYFRGEVPVKDDVDVTPQDLTSRHLVLFGDPSSNSLIADAMADLPFTWTKDKIAWGGKEYAAAEHVPALVYPSPVSMGHYVVLNTGHTFHADDLQGSNALLYPRLGDYAILKLAGDKKNPLAVEVQKAGLFDDYWRLPEERTGGGRDQR